MAAIPHELEQRVRRLAHRLSADDDAYDNAVERITLLVSEALEYQRECDAAQMRMEIEQAFRRA